MPQSLFQANPQMVHKKAMPSANKLESLSDVKNLP